MTSRVCELDGCSQSLDSRRASARYCCDRHRTAACRARQQAQEVKQASSQVNHQGEGAVTVGASPVTPAGAPCGGCPDPSYCLFRWRRSGPWACATDRNTSEATADGVHGYGGDAP